MKHFTSTFRCLVAVVLCLVGMSAYADPITAITVGGNSVPVVYENHVAHTEFAGVAYSGAQKAFDYAAVCSAIGVEKLSDATKYIVNLTTNEAVENTSDGWRDENGDLCTWGNVTKGYCMKIDNPDTGMIDYIGARDITPWADGETFTGVYAFVANEKAALVVLDITITDKPVAPRVAYIDELTVVKTVEQQSTREALNNASETFTVEVGDLKALLGIEDDAFLESEFGQLVCADFRDNNTFVTTGQLVMLKDFACVHQTLDPDTDSNAAECAASDDDNGNAFYVSDVFYDAAVGTVTFTISQKKGTILDAETLFTNIYIAYTDKAVCIKYTMSITPAEIKGLADMTKVGECDIISYQDPSSGYGTLPVAADEEAIAEALGCTSDEWTVKELSSEDNFYEGAYTTNANEYGWWLNPEGFVTTYGSSSVFFLTRPNEQSATFNVGQFPNTCQEGETYTTKIYYIFGEKYYVVNLTLQLNGADEDDVPMAEWKEAAIRRITIQQEQDDNYTFSPNGVMINNEWLEENIGTTTPIIYGQLAEADENGLYFTKKYTCAPEPGFWLDAEGHPRNWNDNTPWGLSTAQTTSADGIIFQGIQLPGQTKNGDVFKGTIYLVNPKAGIYATVYVTYIIGEGGEEEEYTEVGQTSIKLPLNADGDGLEVNFDFAPIAEALGLESVDELYNGEFLRALNASTNHYTDAQSIYDYLYFDKYGDAETASGNIAYMIAFNDGTIGATVADPDETKIEKGFKLGVTLCFQNAEKRYVVNVTLVDEDTYFHKSRNLAIAGDWLQEGDEWTARHELTEQTNGKYTATYTFKLNAGESKWCNFKVVETAEDGTETWYSNPEGDGYNYYFELYSDEDCYLEYTFTFDPDTNTCSWTSAPATAIQSIRTDATKAAIYDLAGRRVQKATKGICVINGKKVLR